MTATITAESLKLFLAFADDAGNWSGNPLVGGNVEVTAATRGNLTQLKKEGLLTTFRDEGCVWVEFTDAGKKLAADNGIDLSWI